MANKLKYKTEDIITQVIEIIQEHGKDNVIRISKLIEEAYKKSDCKLPKSPATLTKYIDQDNEANICIHPDGYVALKTVNIDEWRKKHITSRKTILPKTQNRLWSEAAGHCQFPGCNKNLWLDDITHTSDNFGQIAHIVADSPDGPRGSIEDSEKKATLYENLMILCHTHHKLIDSHYDYYTIEALEKIKTTSIESLNHLIRTRSLPQTTVLRFVSNIGTQKPNLPKITPNLISNYTTNNTITFDLTGDETNELDDDYWTSKQKAIIRKWERERDETCDHISIFPLANIPFCLLLGKLIGSKKSVSYYQFNRTNGTWEWPITQTNEPYQYTLNIPTESNSDNIALILNISAQTNILSIEKITNEKPFDIYTLSVNNPSYLFLDNHNKITHFSEKIIELYNNIEARYQKHINLHIFGAIPASLAIEIARQAPPTSPITLHTYQYMQNIHKPVLKIPPSL